MENLNAFFAILIGLALRLAIPILITALAVLFLRRLDARWRTEGESIPLKVQKPKCWEVFGCSTEERTNCPAAASELPCWQAKRLPNGYLREACLDCVIFRQAPIPSHV